LRSGLYKYWVSREICLSTVRAATTTNALLPFLKIGFMVVEGTATPKKGE
jgi:hypothetical protein